MKVLVSLRLAAATLALAAASSQALDIQLSVAANGQHSALSAFSFGNAFGSSMTGGGSFEAVVNAAAGTWESLLQDNRTVAITIGWATLAGSTMAQSYIGVDGAGEILFNRNKVHYADPSPLDSAEYSGYTETVADLGGGLINVGRGYTGGPTAADLYSTALHEIGHVLGNPLNGPYGGGAASFSVSSGLFAGTALACGDTTYCAHLNLPEALMGPTGGAALYERTLVSGADLLYVATDGGYTQFDSALVAALPVPEPAPALLLAAGLAGLRLRSRWQRA